MKFGVFADLHMLLNYTPESSENLCGEPPVIPPVESPEEEKDPDPIARLGRVGCDAPKELIETMI